MVDAVMEGRNLQTSRAELLQSLDPRHFVNIRRIPGGTAPEVVREGLNENERDIIETEAWMNAKSAHLAAYPQLIRAAIETLSRQ